MTDDEDLSRSAVGSGIHVLPARAVESVEFARWIERNRIDLLLNVHSLHIVHPEVVRAPRVGSFNLHPGPLPQYAGLMAPSWALFNGESSHAVTVHWMEEGIDTGPIAYASSFPISESDTGLSVSARCVREGIPLILRLLDAASVGSIPAAPQDIDCRRYFGRQPPNGGCITWGWDAQQLVNFVRACDYVPFRSPWGHPRAKFGDRDLFIMRARRTLEPADGDPGLVGSVEDGNALVAAGDEWIRLEWVEIGEGYVRASEVLAAGDRLLDGVQSSAPPHGQNHLAGY